MLFSTLGIQLRSDIDVNSDIHRHCLEVASFLVDIVVYAQSILKLISFVVVLLKSA